MSETNETNEQREEREEKEEKARKKDLKTIMNNVEYNISGSTYNPTKAEEQFIKKFKNNPLQMQVALRAAGNNDGIRTNKKKKY